ncbi:hypothetical protein TNCV_3453361 [Trichonephila clavipes]|nr:hypothetical protein TNCV_2191081 [Trichonephila clavipes]GFX74388.1 hypothetical protein TNCV_3453361 [Trichonephila clavipes]
MENDQGYCTQQASLTPKHTAVGQTENLVEGMRGSEAEKPRDDGSHIYPSARKNSSLALPQHTPPASDTFFFKQL